MQPDSQAGLAVIVDAETNEAFQRIYAGLPGDEVIHSTGGLSPFRKDNADAVIIDRSMARRSVIADVERYLAIRPQPIVVFVEKDPDSLAREVVRSGASAFVVDGSAPARIRPVVEIAIERFLIQKSLQDELDRTRENLAARKLIEQAKGILMSRRNLTEDEAYRSLRAIAMKQGKPIKDVAASLLTSLDLWP
ncbi:MAG: ANTAR domain-containing protein [Hyphomonas sp.]